MSIHYTISPYDPAAHLFLVELNISEPDPQGQLVYLPTWIPGSYLIREFAKHIVSIKAHAAGQEIALRKIDKASWQADPVVGSLVIQCIVYAYDLSVRGAYLDLERGFFNGTSVFLAVGGQENTACQVQIKAPASSAWRVATSLKPIDVDHAAFGWYEAQDYDDLIDHPVEMSSFSEVSFDACGVPHRVVISGRHQADLARLAKDLQRICEYQIQFFGTPAPFKDYVFLTLAVGDGYGGLEHRSSTALICKRSDLPLAHETEIKPGYLQFLGLCSHEYFHSWNVKRIKPAAYAPYDLQQESYSRLLWAFEGITSYYDDLFLVRAGLISQQTYLDLLSQTITSVERAPGRQVQTLEDASFDAWIKYYRQDENSPNALVSYYAKGALFALCLDLTIRQRTSGTKSLDDVMRALWTRYGVSFEQTKLGVPESLWEQIAQEVTGVDLSDLFELGLRSTADLPLQALLTELGVEWQRRAASSASDKGGWQASPSKPSCVIGAKTAVEAGGVKLTHVLTQGAAHLAGLSAGDVLFAWNGLRLSVSNLDQFLSSSVADEQVKIHAFRRDELIVVDLRLQAAPMDTLGLKAADGIVVDFLKG